MKFINITDGTNLCRVHAANWDVVTESPARLVSLPLIQTEISVETPNSYRLRHTHLEHAPRQLDHVELPNPI